MRLSVSPTKAEAGRLAAEAGAACLRRALDRQGQAGLVLATGSSQFEMLDHLVCAPDLAWDRVTVFHLDEYVGLPFEHPASFRRYLQERFVDRLPGPVRVYHFIQADREPERECARLNQLITSSRIDVAFVGIGENGHLAFNDPPADFETETPYLVVTLDEACRRQQFNEGWFSTVEDVPRRAISMSVRQILLAGTIICTVSEARKAPAVREALEGPVAPSVPASILRTHADCRIFLDRPAAALLSEAYAA
jgi:glucosamine-6-phosphate deaminase